MPFLQLLPLLLLFTHLASANDTIFTHIASLPSISNLSSFTVSHSNEILVVAHNQITCFLNDGSTFQPFQSLPFSMQYVMVTDDGSWLMGVENSKKIYIFKFKQQYELYQEPIQLNDSFKINSAYIANELLLVGKENGKLYAYKFKESQYLFDQTLVDVRLPISSLSSTEDNSKIVLGLSKSSYVLVRKGDSFSVLQIITVSQAEHIVSFNNDGSYLLIGSENMSYTYRYDDNRGKYSQINSKSFSEPIVSISVTDEFLAITTTKKTQISRNFLSSQILTAQTIHEKITNIGQMLSKNGQFLFLGQLSNLSVYRNVDFENCNIPYCLACDANNQSNAVECIMCNEIFGYYLNTENYKCEKCSMEGCLQCMNLTYCQFCNEEENYYLNYENGKCVSCTDLDCQVNGCQIYKDSFYNPITLQCQFCSLQGCSDCATSQTCKSTACSAQDNFFYDPQTKKCYKCSLPSCIKCKTESTCEINSCNASNNHFYSPENENCEMCQVDGCLKCDSMVTCQPNGCHQDQNYFFEKNSRKCEKCALQGCLHCEDRYSCKQNRCNEQLDYFYDVKSRICVKCSLKQCFDCKNLTFCERSGCNQLSNYIFDERSGQCFKCQLDGCHNCLNQFQCSKNSCDEGYYFTNNICRKCLLVGCKNHCQSYSMCKRDRCDNGYVWENSLCYKCKLNGCLQCKSRNQCKICNEANNYFLKGSTCQKCSLVGCDKCASLTTCKKDGCSQFYEFQTNNCQLSCHYPCKNCSQWPNICTSCEEGYTLIENNCFPSLNSHPVILARKNPYFCSSNGCVNCNFWKKCTSCQTGYYLSSDDICTACPRNCESCLQNKNTCSQCIEGYFLNLKKNCEKCTKNCLKCSSTKCSVCERGFYHKGNKCLKCSESCIECNSKDCIKCDFGYNLAEQNLRRLCRQCVGNCSTCLNDNLSLCSSCHLGFYLENQLCKKCLPGCKNCFSDNLCEECSHGYKKNDQTLKCQKVCQFPCKNCLQDDQKLCTSCFDGYFLQNNKCKENLTCNKKKQCQDCPQFFYLSKEFQCQKCSKYGENCKKCQNGFKIDSKMKNCEKCPRQCQICSLNSCIKCSPGYFMVLGKKEKPTGKCQPCSFRCKECEFSKNQCSKCEKNFELIGFRCVSKKRIGFKIQLQTSVSNFSREIQKFKKELTFFNKDEPIVILNISEGSTNVEGLLNIKKNDDSNQIFTKLKKYLDKKNSKIGNFQVLSSSLERVNFEPEPQKQLAEVSVFLPLVIAFAVIIIILVIVVSCVVIRRIDDNQETTEGEEEQTQEQKKKNPENRRKSMREKAEVEESPRKMIDERYHQN